MEIKEINSGRILKEKIVDLLKVMGSRVKANYKNEIYGGEQEYNGFLVLYESYESEVVQKKLFGLFKYQKIENKLIVRVGVKNNKIKVIIFDWVVYPIVKDEFTKFAEENNVEELTFVKGFVASEK